MAGVEAFGRFARRAERHTLHGTLRGRLADAASAPRPMADGLRTVPAPRTATAVPHHRDVALTPGREAVGREGSPTGGVLENQVAKTPFAGTRGYDGGRRIVGRKRHASVDTDERLLMMNLTPDVSDSAGVQAILSAIRGRSPRLKHLFADASHDRTRIVQKTAFLGFIVKILRHFDAAKGSEAIPRRLAVERPFGWMIHWRRLVRDYQKRLGACPGS